MPELPDVTVYVDALRERIVDHTLARAYIRGPFLLRSATPPPQALEGKPVREVRRVGKRIAIGVDGDLWLVLHLMIAGRLHWKPAGARPAGRNVLAVFDFDNGSVVFTEAGTQHRASLHIVSGEEGLRALDPHGLEILDATLDSFAAALTSENHTLKRALTDPRLFSGIGNAYSDEILFHASLSPVAMTSRLTREEIARLFDAARETLQDWTTRLRNESRGAFPEKVTAFRKGMAVHGRYGEPCPRCGTKIQRIRYAANETNYCARCQTGGKLLADRALSRLLREDWPRTLDELENLKNR
jgi:formamidopyrimidine-DNA glycosylase